MFGIDYVVWYFFCKYYVLFNGYLCFLKKYFWNVYYLLLIVKVFRVIEVKYKMERDVGLKLIFILI